MNGGGRLQGLRVLLGEGTCTVGMANGCECTDEVNVVMDIWVVGECDCYGYGGVYRVVDSFGCGTPS